MKRESLSVLCLVAAVFFALVVALGFDPVTRVDEGWLAVAFIALGLLLG